MTQAGSLPEPTQKARLGGVHQPAMLALQREGQTGDYGAHLDKQASLTQSAVKLFQGHRAREKPPSQKTSHSTPDNVVSDGGWPRPPCTLTYTHKHTDEQK